MAKPFAVDNVVPFAFGIEDAVIANTGVVEFDPAQISLGQTTGSFHVKNVGTETETAQFTITRSDHPDISIDSGVVLEPGEIQEVTVTFPQGSFEYLTADIRMSSGNQTLDFAVWQPNGQLGDTSNDKFYVDEQSDRIDIRTNDANDALVMRIFTDDTISDFEAVFRGTLTGVRCEITYDIVKEDGFWGLNVKHRVYNPTASTVEIMDINAHNDWLSLTAGNEFTTEVQEHVYRTITTEVTGTTQTAQNGGTGGTGIFLNQAVYPNNLQVPAFIFQHRGADNGSLGYDIKYSEAWVVHKEVFREEDTKRLRFVHGRSTGGGAAGVTGWRKILKWEDSPTLTGSVTGPQEGSFGDTYELEPGEEYTFTLLLRFDTVNDEVTGDFSWIDKYRRIVRAFAGDIKYNPNFDGRLNLSGSFGGQPGYNDNVASTIADGDGWRFVDTVPSVDALFDSGVDTSQIAFATLNEGEALKVRVAAAQAHPPSATHLYLQVFDGDEFFANPESNTWYVDTENDRMYVNFGSSLDISTFTNFSILDDTNPWFFVASFPERVGGWGNFIENSIETARNERDWNNFIIRRITGEPWRHIGMSPAAFADAANPNYFPVSAATINEMLDYLEDNPDVKFSGWWGRSTRMTEDFYTTDAEQIYHDNGEESRIREARELDALVEWGWEGCGFDAFPDQSYGRSYPRIQYLREAYGPDFYMAEEPDSCDVMATWTQQWVVETKIFSGAENNEPIGTLDMLKFIVPRCEVVGQTRAGNYGNTSVTEDSIAWLYQNGFRPEIYANSQTASNQLDYQPNRPTTVQSFFFVQGDTTTSVNWNEDANGYTDEFLVEVSRNSSFTDMIARSIVDDSETSFSFLNSEINATGDFLYARITPSNDSYVGDSTTAFLYIPPDGDDDDGSGDGDGPLVNLASSRSPVRRPVTSNRIEDNSLFGLYPKSLADTISYERRDISFDAFILSLTELGLYPTAGPHQMLADETWIDRHEIQVYADTLRKVKNREYSGMVLVDYRGRWHPHFDYSAYESSDGYFTDEDFDDSICTSGKLFYEDKNYREDFYNYLYCSDPSTVNALDPETELEPYMKEQWNAISRSFYEATVRGLRKAIPNAKIGFINLPSAIYKDSNLVSPAPGVVGYGNRFDELMGDTYNIGQRINNELSWLWEIVDVLPPAIKPLRFSVSDGATPQNGIENTLDTNATYISSNVLEAHRLQTLYGVSYVVPVFNHLYASLPPYTRQPLSESNFRQQLQLPFAAGANAIALAYNGQTDPDGAIQSDYKNEIPTYLPKSSGRGFAGGSRNRAMGGLSSTGQDLRPLSVAPIQADELEEFMPLQLTSTAAGPLGGIDRRPVRLYVLWEDSFLSSTGAVNGFASWWEAAEGVSNLIDRMQADYNKGFRRFMFYMPAGNQINNSGYYSPNQWGPIISSRQTEIETILADWIANRLEAIEVSVMGGIRFEPDLTKLDTHEIDYDNAVPYDLADNSLHRNYFEQNWQPWLDAGASSIALHNACADDVLNFYLELAINQSLANNKIYGSCLPLSAAEEIDESLITFSPWIVRYNEFLDLQGSASFEFDPESTEVGVMLTPQMAFSAEDVESMQAQGLVIYAAEGTVADDVLFSDRADAIANQEVEFVQVQGAGTDPIDGFGVPRYNPVNTAIDGADADPPYSEFALVAVANSVNGIVVISSPLTKRDVLTLDITNPTFDNTSLPHATIEDTFEWVNSGLPSHLAQTRDSNVVQMGLNMTRTNESAMAMVPPYQAKYILPCSSDVYDVFNSTVDFEVLADFGRRNFSLPYATAVVYIEELGQVWVGGPGGVLSIDSDTYEIDEVVLDRRRDLQIKDMFVRNSKVYILDQTALYIYDLNENTVSRDPGLGWTSEVFEFINFFNTNLAVGGEDGIYARRELDDQWTLVQETSSNVDSMIAPDAGFAIADSEVFYTTDGFTWTSIGTANRSINGLVKYRNRIYVATDEGIYEDGGFFYAERVSLRLIDVFNDAEESRDIVANDIDASQLQVVAGLDDGRLVTINDFGFTISDSELDTIHKVIIVEDDVWMFSYNSFKIKSQTQLRRLVSGQRL